MRRLRVTEAPKLTPAGVTSTAFSSGTWVTPTRIGQSAFLNFISIPTSLFPATSRASGCAARSASSAARVVGRCQVAAGPGMQSAAGVRRRSSGGKIGSAARAEARRRHQLGAFPHKRHRINFGLAGSQAGAAAGGSALVGRAGVTGPQHFSLCSPRDSTAPLAASTSPQSQGLPVLGHTAFPAAFFSAGAAAAAESSPAARRLAAMASSEYAPGSTLAKALKASRIGRYPVQRLRAGGGATEAKPLE